MTSPPTDDLKIKADAIRVHAGCFYLLNLRRRELIDCLRHSLPPIYPQV